MSTSEFDCTFEGFKQQASEFFKRLKKTPAPTDRQIEAGLHALSLAYIYMTGTENERYQCEIMICLADREAMKIRENQ
jgi:hypothetical protein